MKNILALTDTLSSNLHVIPNAPTKPFTMYVCGITPYDAAHLGHGRCYITFDILLRLLKYAGKEVLYCRNITDIDDKLIAKSHALYGTGDRFLEIANHFYEKFLENLDALNCMRPLKEPRVTEVIPDILEFIGKLIEKGHAYIVGQDVYFDVTTYQAYGTLAHRDLSEQRSGARVSVNEKKRNPLDFALWKGSPEKPFWESPWGTGRPGWHIECSVMAKKCCGETVDIHGGGMDLIFPHHENERAQSESCNDLPFVKTWVHCAFIQVNAEKMSKSLNNFVTLSEVIQKYDPMIFRYFVASHHYRSPLDFSWEALDVAHKTYKKLVRLFQDANALDRGSLEGEAEEIYQKSLRYLYDDMNTVGFLGVIFEYSEKIRSDKALAGRLKDIIQNVLGLHCVPLREEEQELSEEIRLLMQEREEARKNKDWARADKIRDLLKEKGICLQDKKI